MLSEVAKGKQRAIDPESLEEERPPISVVVRFTEGISDLTVDILDQTVSDVKRNIRLLRTQLKDRRLRLIHSGRLLTDDTPLYPLLSSHDERPRHSASREEDHPQDASTSIIWLHCSVGPQLSPGEEEEAKVQMAQLKPLRGFDRLAAAGFSEQDIANIRLQFHAHSAGDYLDHDFASDEDCACDISCVSATDVPTLERNTIEVDEHARVLEEQWIDSIDNAGSASLSQSSSSSTLLSGVMTGFFFPIYSSFFFHQSKPAVFWEDGTEHEVVGTIVFSRRMQIWIVVGFIMNLLFGVWTYFLASD